MLRRQADQLEQLGDPPSPLARACRCGGSRAPRRRCSPPACADSARRTDPGRRSASRGAWRAARAGAARSSDRALEADVARRRLDQAQDQAAERRLAAARLADQAEGLAGDGCPATRRRPRGRRAAAVRRRRGRRESACGGRATSTSGASVMRGCRRRGGRRGAPRAADRPRRTRRSRADSGRGSAPARQPRQARHLSRDRLEAIAGACREPASSAAAPACTGAAAAEELVDRGVLDDAPGVHDRDPVRLLGDDAEVVRDQEHRHAVAIAQRRGAARGSAPGS